MMPRRPVPVHAPVLGSLTVVVESESSNNSGSVSKQQPQRQDEPMVDDHPQETASLSDSCASSSASNPNNEEEENNGLVRTTTAVSSTAVPGDDDDDDAAARHKTTARQAFVHLLKGYVGPGCLSLPWAVSQLGIVPGCLAIAAVAYWSSYNCWTVVQLKLLRMQQQQMQQQQQQSLSAAQLNNNNTNITYPGLARWLWGPLMERGLTACVCVQQLAVCTVFLSFLGVNLRAVLEESIVSVPVVHHVTVITVALPAVLALSCVPDLRALAPFIFVATVLLLVGLGLLLSLIAVEWENRPASRGGNYGNGAVTDNGVEEWNNAQVPLAICAILYSFEGVCLILPVQSSMRQPRRFGPVFVSAMAVSALIFCLVAGLSVAAFGNVTSGSITAFLLEKYVHNNNDNSNGEHSEQQELLQSLLLSANAAVSFSVLITYPLQLFPCFELIGPLLTACRGRILTRRRRRRHDHVQLTNNTMEETTAATTTRTASGDRGDFTALSGNDEEHDDNNVDDPNHHHHHRLPIATNDDDDDNEVSDHSSDHYDDSDPHLSSSSLSSSSSGDTRLGRVLLVLVTYVLAVAVPNVESMISLAGALAGSIVALLVPPAMQIAYCRQQQRQQGEETTTNTKGVLVRSVLLFTAGLIFMVIGTGASLWDIVKIYKSG